MDHDPFVSSEVEKQATSGVQRVSTSLDTDGSDCEVTSSYLAPMPHRSG